MKKTAMLLALLLFLGTVAYLSSSRLLTERSHGIIEISGSIETTEVDVSFQIPGKIKTLLADEGKSVQKGELLALLDDEDLLRQREASRAALDAAESQLPLLQTRIDQSRKLSSGKIAQAYSALQESQTRYRQLRNGSRPQEIAVATREVEAARSHMNFLKDEYERARHLYREGAMPGQQRDLARTNYQMSTAQYRQAVERLSLALEGPRAEEIQAGRERVRQAEAAFTIASASTLETRALEQQVETLEAQIRQARAFLASLEIQLKQTHLHSPLSGVVLAKSREIGEVVSPGTPVVTLGEIEKVWLRAYIHETDLGRVKLGQRVEVRTDTFPDRSYQGRIYYIASQAEFTPKTLQTKEDRVKLVYRIKVALENPQQELKPGMIADGRILLGPE